MIRWLFNRKPWYEPDFLLSQINQLKKDIFRLSFKCPFNLGDEIAVYHNGKIEYSGIVSGVLIKDIGVECSPCFCYKVTLLDSSNTMQWFEFNEFSNYKIKVISRFTLENTPLDAYINIRMI